MITTREECGSIWGALDKLGCNSGYDRHTYGIKDWEFNVAHSLVLPFGCLYNDVSNDGIYWSEPLSIQSSLPCGSIAEERQFFCFCKNKTSS